MGGVVFEIQLDFFEEGLFGPVFFVAIVAAVLEAGAEHGAFEVGPAALTVLFRGTYVFAAVLLAAVAAFGLGLDHLGLRELLVGAVEAVAGSAARLAVGEALAVLFPALGPPARALELLGRRLRAEEVVYDDVEVRVLSKRLRLACLLFILKVGALPETRILVVLQLVQSARRSRVVERRHRARHVLSRIRTVDLQEIVERNILFCLHILAS